MTFNDILLLMVLGLPPIIISIYFILILVKNHKQEKIDLTEFKVLQSKSIHQDFKINSLEKDIRDLRSYSEEDDSKLKKLTEDIDKIKNNYITLLNIVEKYNEEIKTLKTSTKFLLDVT